MHDEDLTRVAPSVPCVDGQDLPQSGNWAQSPQQEPQERAILRALKNYGADVECGACMEVAFTGCTTNQHTCRDRNELQQQLIATWRARATVWSGQQRGKAATLRLCADELERLLAVSPVPWAGSGEEEELTRGGTQDYAVVSSPPQPPDGDK
jgi:hypothetical protein